MNWNLFVFFVAVGAMAELLTLKHPTPGEQYAAGFQVATFGFIAALVIPPSANTAVVTGLFIAASGRVVGSLLAPQFDKLRLWIDERRDAKTIDPERP